MTNLCYDQFRNWKRTRLGPLEPVYDGDINESPYWIKDPAMLPEETIVRSELQQAILSGLETLPSIFRIAVTLVDVQELSYEEAAFVMGISMGTLKSRLARGRLMFRKAFMKRVRAEGFAYELTG